MKNIFSILILLILCACDGTPAPNLKDKMPDIFPIEQLVYTRQIYQSACIANVFKLKDGFDKNFQEKLDAQLWQRTPIHEKIYYMSKAAGTLSFAQDCFQNNKYYMNLFIKYASEEGAYFYIPKGDGDVFIYTPNENILIYANWD